MCVCWLFFGELRVFLAIKKRHTSIHSLIIIDSTCFQHTFNNNSKYEYELPLTITIVFMIYKRFTLKTAREGAPDGPRRSRHPLAPRPPAPEALYPPRRAEHAPPGHPQL